MPALSRILALLATSALPFVAAPGHAQEQTAQDAQPAQEATPDAGLAMGEPVDETRQPGDTYIKETIGDWALRCVVMQAGDDRCQLYQLLEDQEKQPIAEFSMLKLPEGGQARGAATVIVPLETSLQNQLTIKVDDQPGKRYPFAFCNQVGCYARIGLTAEDVEAYKRGTAAVVSIVPVAAPDVTVSVTLSLKGFTAAFDTLETANPSN